MCLGAVLSVICPTVACGNSFTMAALSINPMANQHPRRSHRVDGILPLRWQHRYDIRQWFGQTSTSITVFYQYHLWLAEFFAHIFGVNYGFIFYSSCILQKKKKNAVQIFQTNKKTHTRFGYIFVFVFIWHTKKKKLQAVSGQWSSTLR